MSERTPCFFLFGILRSSSFFFSRNRALVGQNFLRRWCYGGSRGWHKGKPPSIPSFAAVVINSHRADHCCSLLHVQYVFEKQLISGYLLLIPKHFENLTKWSLLVNHLQCSVKDLILMSISKHQRKICSRGPLTHFSNAGLVSKLFLKAFAFATYIPPSNTA